MGCVPSIIDSANADVVHLMHAVTINSIANVSDMVCCNATHTLVWCAMLPR